MWFWSEYLERIHLLPTFPLLELACSNWQVDERGKKARVMELIRAGKPHLSLPPMETMLSPSGTSCITYVSSYYPPGQCLPRNVVAGVCTDSHTPPKSIPYPVDQPHEFYTLRVAMVGPRRIDGRRFRGLLSLTRHSSLTTNTAKCQAKIRRPQNLRKRTEQVVISCAKNSKRETTRVEIRGALYVSILLLPT